MSTTPCLFALAFEAWPFIWLADLLRYLIPTLLAAGLVAVLPEAFRNARSVQPRPTRCTSHGGIASDAPNTRNNRLRLEQLVQAASLQPPTQLPTAHAALQRHDHR